jgi:hypothetical protein
VRDFKAFLNDEGKKIWGNIFPDGLVPVLFPVPQWAYLEPGKEEKVYMVAWDLLSPVQRGQIINLLAEKFQAPASAVEKQILTKGMPLRASLVNGSCIPARYF